jgi:hypothetical protein
MFLFFIFRILAKFSAAKRSSPTSFFSFGEISPNFDLQNMISTYTKDFPCKKDGPNSPDFYDKFQ